MGRIPRLDAYKSQPSMPTGETRSKYEYVICRLCIRIKRDMNNNNYACSNETSP